MELEREGGREGGGETSRSPWYKWQRHKKFHSLVGCYFMKVPGSTNSSIIMTCHWPITPADTMESFIGGSLSIVELARYRNFVSANCLENSSIDSLPCAHSNCPLFVASRATPTKLRRFVFRTSYDSAHGQ